MTNRGKILFAALLAIVAATACRKPDPIIKPTVTPVGGDLSSAVAGFFLLNEGNMGSNKCTIDYYDYTSGIYSRNIYPERNPNVVKELGDVGNDLQIYGGKLYAVVNCSNLVEVMDVRTAKHLASISIPNCRYVTFDGKYAYVSSYAGPVEIDPNSRLGYVARIDTTSLSVIDTCVVGYQPEEMVIAGGKLYVANSGGYRVPDYDNTISVIDLASFKEVSKIEVAPNLHRMELDNYGNIWVSSRGDYYSSPSKTYVVSTKSGSVTDELDLLACSEMTICGDSLYVISNQWSYLTQTNDINYAIVDVKSKRVVTRRFIPEEFVKQIKTPYGLAVNPSNRDIFICDAKDYITPGKVHCFGSDGKIKWSATAGDVPAHIAFTGQSLQ